ncbi:MAG: cysteine desulfurase [Prolixibacteraceae bacterium]|nr:cysteine desulfurase [Prolixibacteraceae bacterium]
MDFNYQDIRKDFPILDQQVNKRPWVYFDNAATAQRPIQVIEKIREFSVLTNANIHRGTHAHAIRTTEAYENARDIVKDFLHAKEREEIIFTHGTTESINLVARSFCEKFLSDGDEIIVTEMEHHANIVPWQMACERHHTTLKVLPFADDGTLKYELLESLISDRTKILAVAHVSNTLGSVNPIKEIIRVAHRHNIPVLVDGAQSVPHITIDVQDLDCDFFAFSGHKIYGPTGIGVLYGKRSWLDTMPPFLGGGEMIDRVTFEKTTYNELPHKFEAGTPHYVGAIGLGSAIQYIQNIGVEKIASYEHQLLSYATDQMKLLEKLKIFGESPNKTGVICFQLDQIHPFDLGTLLDQLGIAVRTGRLCADPVMDHFGVTAMTRASFAFYNSTEEIDRFIEALKRVRLMFA